MIRAVESEADLEAWAQVKNAVVPEEPVTVEQLRRATADDRILLLAEVDGEVVGSGIAGRSHVQGRCFLAPRVLPAARGRGIGTALFRACAAHGRALGLELGSVSVDGRDDRSIGFARRFGFDEVDRELEQVRAVAADEPPPAVPPGVELVSIADRPELLEAAYAVASEGYADLPIPASIEVSLEEWLRDEASLPHGSFVALADDGVVGYAGLLERAEAGTAEHGLTVVRRSRRRSGLATMLKRAQIHWAATHGLHELVTWTQTGNEAMQAVNERLGYSLRTISLRMWGPLP